MRYIIVRYFMISQYFVHLKYTCLVLRFAPFATMQHSFSIYFYTDICIHARIYRIAILSAVLFFLCCVYTISAARIFRKR